MRDKCKKEDKAVNVCRAAEARRGELGLLRAEDQAPERQRWEMESPKAQKYLWLIHIASASVWPFKAA